MIGKITIGKSFGGCIRYCLEDKLELSHEEKLSMSRQDGLKHEHRAEVLEYNMCYGNKKELTRQFNEVRALRPQLLSPVMHITLSLDQEDIFTKETLRQMGQDFAREFGFENNQYLVIYHQDTKHPHLHIVINRVGFDGTRINDSNSYRKVANLCRKLELKYELKQVLNPERFMTLQQRQEHKQEQRIDQRKERLKQNIRDCLLNATNFSDFIRKMEQQKIQIIKSRGISFIDDKKMKVKGSEVGYSLSTIEKVLSHSFERRQRLFQKLEQEKKQSPEIDHKQQSKSLSFTISNHLEQQKDLDLNKFLELLLRQERDFNQIPYELIHQKRKRKNQSQHLSR
ncbi:MAG: relaxase/mobilization nuclease domain-containing protein [Bacteroidetes bacterium]|nr:relaxase/mobilization nuclease domain-containing protein [Bacteroidota bacterium]MDP3127016.1 relaxase/mobilization nuclease domain-containing protein [Sediminibacterium sp.]